MRRWFAATLIALFTMGARADEVRSHHEMSDLFSQRVAAADRLLKDRQATWIEDIAGFNRRSALCDPKEARAAATYDAMHATRFERTLSFRWDAAANKWVPTSAKQAEILLVFSGPVRSGTMTIDGRTQSFCRAEAPNALAAFGRSDMDNEGRVHRIGSSVDLPPLVPGFTGSTHAQPAYVAVEPDTPQAEVNARIAEAQAWLEETLATLDSTVANNRKNSVCDRTTAVSFAAQHSGSISDLTARRRYDKAQGRWVRADNDVQEEVGLLIKGPSYFGPVELDGHTTWVCYAIQPATVATRVTWRSEGENVLTFTADAPLKPSSPTTKSGEP